MEIKVRKMECKRCGHKWVPRKAEVRQCPRCKSAYFDQSKPKGA